MTVVNRDPAADNRPHVLFLREDYGGGEKKIYEYGRHVLVAWSPDGHRLAITDYVGSNVAECLVLDARTLKTTDVVDQAVRSSKKISRIMSNFHSYFECLRWTSNQSLEVKVSGHGDNDPDGATLTTQYRLR